MITVRKSSLIEAPPQRIYTVLADVARTPEWVSATEEVSNLRGSPGQVGFRYSERTRQGGRTVDSEWELVLAEHPRRLHFAGRFRAVTVRTEFEITDRDAPSECLVEATIRVAPRSRLHHPFVRLARSRIRAQIDTDLGRDLDKLAAVVR